MKNASIFFSFLAVVAFLGFAFTNPESDAVESYSVNTEQSVIKWKAYKVTGQHNGTVKVQSGNLEFDGDMLQGGEFTIDMASITVGDLEGKYKQKLEGHLKSEDFFGVESIPPLNLSSPK